MISLHNFEDKYEQNLILKNKNFFVGQIIDLQNACLWKLSFVHGHYFFSKPRKEIIGCGDEIFFNSIVHPKVQEKQ